VSIGLCHMLNHVSMWGMMRWIFENQYEL
jgi:hypothetical protein